MPGLQVTVSAVGSQAPERQPQLFVVLPPLLPFSPPSVFVWSRLSAHALARSAVLWGGKNKKLERTEKSILKLYFKRQTRYIQFHLKINMLSATALKWYLINTSSNTPLTSEYHLFFSEYCNSLSSGNGHIFIERHCYDSRADTKGALKWHLE